MAQLVERSPFPDDNTDYSDYGGKPAEDWSVGKSVGGLVHQAMAKMGFGPSEDEQRVAASQAKLNTPAPVQKTDPLTAFLDAGTAAHMSGGPVLISQKDTTAPAPVQHTPDPGPVVAKKGGPGLKDVSLPDNDFIKQTASVDPLRNNKWEPEQKGTVVNDNTPPRDELKELQDAANRQKDLLGAFQLMNSSAADFAGDKRNDEWFKDRIAGSDKNVKDFLQRRDIKNQDKERAEKDASQDAMTKATQTLGRAYGLPEAVVKDLNYATFPMVQAAGTDKQKQAELIASIEKDKRDRASAEGIAAGHDKAGITEAWIRANADKKAAAAGSQAGDDVAPGFRLGNIPLKETEAKDFRSAVEVHNALAADAKEMRELYQQYGTELTGDAATKMGSLAADMKIKLKDQAKLGALSGSDYALMDARIPDPSSFKANAKGFFNADRTLPMLDELVKTSRNGIIASANAKGLHHVGNNEGGGSAPAPAPEAVAKQLRPGEVAMMDKNGKPHAVAQDEVAQAEHNGWRRM